MDSGWSAVRNWVFTRARSSPPPAQVFSINRLSSFFDVFLSRKLSISCDKAGLESSSSSSVVWLKMWADKHKHTAMFFLAAAIWPPYVNPPACSAALTLKSSGAEISVQSDSLSLERGGCLRREENAEMVVEPKSGAQFPRHLNVDYSSQVLAGVGVRSRQLMKVKSINLYAFGMYVHPESLRDQLADKYGGLSPSELKLRSEFYDDLLRHHEVNLTVRLVVLYKGLTAELIRSAFQVSLRNRLKKIKGTEEDEGLDAFCSYLSGDLKIRKGTVIDIHWQQGGRLHTVVDGRQVGTIFSENLCRAFFDLYIGDPPVSTSAKHNIGENFAKLLNDNKQSH